MSSSTPTTTSMTSPTTTITTTTSTTTPSPTTTTTTTTTSTATNTTTSTTTTPSPTTTTTFAAPTPSQAAILLSPTPRPQPVPTVTHPHTFLPPTKRISTPHDLNLFLSTRTTSASSSFLSFLSSLSHSSLHLSLSHPFPSPLPDPLPYLLHLLSSLSSSISLFPPSPHPSRYGNPSFRLWHSHLSSSLPALLSPFLPTPSLPELLPYLLDSFGNPTRIDYGTGHEANFAAFLYCLARLGLLPEDIYPAVVLCVFPSYLQLMRHLQDTYSLEPAGSHGVWGLDDYHFLPYVFGSAQLVDHNYIKPKSIHNPEVLERFSTEYMYLDCISRIKKVKKGPFAEHSPLLNDISGVPTWSKVHTGLLKMYRADVLGKLPIMQHFLFGSLIKWSGLGAASSGGCRECCA